MKKSHHPVIRELLRQNPDGMTLQQISSALNIAHVKRCLMAMPDAYIDRWTKTHGSRGQYVAVWCVVVPPENCPYPTDRFEKPSTRWVTSDNIALDAA